jgi:syntaxin 16
MEEEAEKEEIDMRDVDLQNIETEDWIQKARGKEITEIVENTKALAELFKELSVMVIDQGTIVDRIDFNMEQALTKTKEGKKHLV